MKKEIRVTDPKRGIIQVTLVDERWYAREARDGATDLPTFIFVPSVTWIAGHYPKGIGFYRWLADKGWDESQAIKQAAGDKGSKVHEAISAICNGDEVRIDSKFLNRSTGQLEELTFEEVVCIQSFVDWKASLQSFEAISWDITVWSATHNYAGSVDLIARVNGEMYIIDFKTSQDVWSEYELQVSAYRQAIINGENPIYQKNENGTEKQVDVSEAKIAILQVGYRRNKNAWKWTEIEDKFPLFLAARQIWQNESSKQQPKQRDYNIVISPGNKVQLDFTEGEVVHMEANLGQDEAVDDVAGKPTATASKKITTKKK